MSHFVEVVLPLSLPTTFTYRVLPEQYNQIKTGCRVSVPFGKTGIYTAVVWDKHQNPPLQYEAKNIYELIDTTPIFTLNQLKLWEWIAEYYMCTIGEVYKSAVPSALLLESESVLVFNSNKVISLDSLSDEEYLIYEAFQNQPILKIGEVVAILNKKKVLPIINSLLEKEIIFLDGETREVYKPKEVKYVRLTSEWDTNTQLPLLLENVTKSEKQRKLILAYFQLKATNKQAITIAKLIETAEVSKAVVQTLVKNNIFEIYTEAVDRVRFENASQDKITLNDAQQIAYQQIQTEFTKKDITLLFGITGSGKTEIYIELIKEQIEKGKQTLFLLPEIALTTQLVYRLSNYFGNNMVVYHSKYSMNERVEVWQKMVNKPNETKLIIGARSSIFLPFENLGLIIVDEEHEGSFKQYDPAPRYNARDTSIVLAQFFKAKTLLGSATPSLETYYNTYQDKYGKVVLNKRYGNSVLPEIQLVDLKESYKKKEMNGHFSNLLLKEISNRLSKNEQVIIFQNRRGFAPVIECTTCGHVPQCTQCDVSLTYYKNRNVLKCHYCGYTIANPTHCIVCKSPDLSRKGFGTEQIEQELQTLFPTKSIGRLDQDSAKGKYAFDKIIQQFKSGAIDILVGTQMLAKGLDFENVTLVGILNADNTLHFPDFRAHERAYQLFMQVAGRAGRKDKIGKVIIQTYNPYHNIIQQVLQNDYEAMFKEQMYDRYNFNYPPFYRLIRLELRHIDFEKLRKGADWIGNALRNHLQIPILGPEEPAVNRIKNQYIRVFLIKIPINIPLKKTKNQIRSILKSFDSIAEYRSIRIIINVDFY